MDDLKGVLDGFAECKRPTLTTMTVLLTLNAEVCLETVIAKMKDQRIIDFICAVLGAEDKLYISNTRKSFNNCVVFKYQGSQAVKVFCNGNLHITGVKSLMDAMDIGEIFTTLLELVYDGTGVDDVFKVVRFDVQLVNFCYKFKEIAPKDVLCLGALLKALRKHTPFYVSHNSEHHAGVILKAPSFTVIIFESGNIILSSLKTAEQLKEAHSFILDFMAAHLEACCVPKPEVPIKGKGKRKYFDYSSYLVLK